MNLFVASGVFEPNRQRRFSCCSLLLIGLMATLFVPVAKGQPLLVKGVAVDDTTSAPVRGLQIINTSTMQRFYGDSSGNFLIQCSPTDTMVFLAKGYAVKRLTFRPVSAESVLEVSVRLKRLEYTLPEVRIAPSRTFEQTQKEMSGKPFDPREYLLQGSERLEHPLTYLYQLLSKRERDRRAYAELVYQDRERALLAELLRGYSELNLISVSDADLPLFVDFLLQHALLNFGLTEYEFIRNLQGYEQIFQDRIQRQQPRR
ncbi:MAG: hypothetical protein RMK52_05205 [Chitinophagales bacterium]|nr:hypothetical protein [Chitinophagales bacterium]MDW8393625.1 hypothetical protein [Chitinophagales bacterium]